MYCIVGSRPTFPRICSFSSRPLGRPAKSFMHPSITVLFFPLFAVSKHYRHDSWQQSKLSYLPFANSLPPLPFLIQRPAASMRPNLTAPLSQLSPCKFSDWSNLFLPNDSALTQVRLWRPLYCQRPFYRKLANSFPSQEYLAALNPLSLCDWNQPIVGDRKVRTPPLEVKFRGSDVTMPRR